jgi:hypothetical protein
MFLVTTTAFEIKVLPQTPSEKQWCTISEKYLSKTTEIYTHVSTAAIKKIRSPIAHLNLKIAKHV